MDKKEKILQALLELDKTHLRALARKTNVHPNTIKDTIKELDVIKTELNEKLFISFKETKKAKFTKTHLLTLQLIPLLEHLDTLLFEPTVILFGSCAKGEMTKQSDIDLCIICDEPKEINLEPFETMLKREIQILMYTKKEFRKISKELRNNILNGIVLQGFVEYEI